MITISPHPQNYVYWWRRQESNTGTRLYQCEVTLLYAIKTGTPGVNRTHGQLLRRQLLYPLSYRRMDNIIWRCVWSFTPQFYSRILQLPHHCEPPDCLFCWPTINKIIGLILFNIQSSVSASCFSRNMRRVIYSPKFRDGGFLSLGCTPLYFMCPRP